MSESVIKGIEFPMCPRCFNTGDHSPECLLDEVDPPPRETVYTRDDLVRAVASTLDYYAGLSDENAQEEANAIVDRLTKGGCVKKPKKPRIAKDGTASIDNWWEVTVRFEFITPLSAEDAAEAMAPAIEKMAETAFLDDRVAAVGLQLPQGYLVKQRPTRPALRLVPK